MAKNGKKMNVGLFIVLLIVFFPAAIIYAIVTNVEPKPHLKGHTARMINAIVWILNGLGLMIIHPLYGLPVVVPGVAMLVCELKNKNSKNKNLIYGYIAGLVVTIAVVAYTGFFVYCLASLVATLIGIVGIYRGLRK